MSTSVLTVITVVSKNPGRNPLTTKLLTDKGETFYTRNYADIALNVPVEVNSSRDDYGNTWIHPAENPGANRPEKETEFHRPTFIPPQQGTSSLPPQKTETPPQKTETSSASDIAVRIGAVNAAANYLDSNINGNIDDLINLAKRLEKYIRVGV